MKTFLFVGLLFGFAAPAWADHVNQGALRILDAGCQAAAGTGHNGFACFKAGVRALIEGRGRYSLISTICDAARGTGHNGWECYKAATAMAINLGDVALRPMDSACRAAAGYDTNGFRCFQRAYSDLAAQERWGAARNIPDAPQF